MEMLGQILLHTPIWVYVLFVYLVMRGIRARKAGETTLLKLAIIPALLTIWGVTDLTRLYGLNLLSLCPWTVAFAAGALIGWMLLRGQRLDIDRSRGIIRRPPDFTVLPLVLLAFAAKYAFGVIAAAAPAMLTEPSFRLADLLSSGLFAGIFAGKFTSYATRFMKVPVRG